VADHGIPLIGHAYLDAGIPVVFLARRYHAGVVSSCQQVWPARRPGGDEACRYFCGQFYCIQPDTLICTSGRSCFPNMMHLETCSPMSNQSWSPRRYGTVSAASQRWVAPLRTGLRRAGRPSRPAAARLRPTVCSRSLRLPALFFTCGSHGDAPSGDLQRDLGATWMPMGADARLCPPDGGSCLFLPVLEPSRGRAARDIAPSRPLAEKAGAACLSRGHRASLVRG